MPTFSGDSTMSASNTNKQSVVVHPAPILIANDLLNRPAGRSTKVTGTLTARSASVTLALSPSAVYDHYLDAMTLKRPRVTVQR